MKVGANLKVCIKISDLTMHSEFKSVVLTPFLHNLHEIFYLRVVGAFKNLNNFKKFLFVFLLGYYHLEHSDGCAALSFPELWIGVQTF